MLLEERQKQIIDFVNEKSSISIHELISNLNVSESTIRRDLIELDNRGLLVKVFGGAVTSQLNFAKKDESIAKRKTCNKDAKVKIGRYAASLIEDGDFVYLDAGTTTECIIPFVKASEVVFVTNSYRHARALCERNFTVYILGGEIKLPTEAIVGAKALECLSQYHFSKGFFGTNAVSAEQGLSTPDVNEALVKKTAMEHTDVNYVLADSTKFLLRSCVTFANMNDAIIISDVIDEQYKQFQNIVEAKDL